MALKRKVDDLNMDRAKLTRKVSVSMNTFLKNNLSTVNAMWTSNEAENEGEEILASSVPFKHCILKNFIQDVEYLKELKEELLNTPFIQKQNDLYQFRHTADLSGIEKPAVNALKEFLAKEVSIWLQKATDINLNNKISVSCSSYSYTDHLLCHDDKCEDRRIAFILYLNEDWIPEYGGSLEFFNTDDDDQPNQVVKRIMPTLNSFVFFEVTSKSFHQVSEIISKDRTRLSVNGWFHGPLPESTERVKNICREMQLYSPVQSDIDPSSYLYHIYWEPNTQDQISDSFEKHSEILLANFFDAHFYVDLCQCLCSEELRWEMQGPANVRKYETLSEETFPLPLQKLVELFKSMEFFDILSDLTKLELSPSQNANFCVNRPKPGGTKEEDVSTSVSGAKFSFEVQRWRKGFYTLMTDNNRSGYALDAFFYCNANNLRNLHGGFTSYIARNEDEELLTVKPCSNSLALTYRDKDTLNFVKYISHVFNDCFHVLHFTFYENCEAEVDLG